MQIKTVLGKILKKRAENFKKEDLNNKIDADLLILELICSRIQNPNQIESYLNPKSKNSLKNPKNLKDFESSIEFIFKAIETNKKMLIFGDYDVDGTISTAILIYFFRQINFTNYEFFIPNRFKHGYGLTKKAIEDIPNLKNIDILIILDCGTSSIEEISYIKNTFNIDTIVIDHHKSNETLPQAKGIINPNRFGELCENEFKDLSASGVLFFFLLILNRKFQKSDENILNLLDLVAISTICDVMPLIKINRFFVNSGLKKINENSRKSIFWIKEFLNSKEINAGDIGFKIGPLINAGGRIEDANLSVKLLTSEDKNECFQIFNKLKAFNEERKEIENEILKEIKLQEELINYQILEYGFVFLYNKNWHEGLVGIISSRIKDKYNRVAIIGFLNENTVKCSARSIENIDIGQNILELKTLNLIINGGGHKMAGGLSFFEENYSKIFQHLSKNIKILNEEYQKIKNMYFDLEVSLASLDVKLVKNLKILEPYGIYNPKPVFLIKNIKVKYYEILKEKYLKLIITDGFTVKNAICFNAFETDMFNILMKDIKIDILVNLDINFYKENESLSIQILDCLLKK